MKRLIVILIAVLAVIGMWRLTETDSEKHNETGAANVTSAPEVTPIATEAPTPTAVVTSKPKAKKNTAKPTATVAPTATTAPKPTEADDSPNLHVSTPTPSPEPTATPTEVPTATPTEVPTATPTPEPTATATPTPEPTATAVPAPTATSTPTPTPFMVKEDEEEIPWSSTSVVLEQESTTTVGTSEEGDYFPDFSGSDAYGGNYGNDTSSTDEP